MIFLGAGASLQFNIPTTQKFTESIENILIQNNEDLLDDFKEHHKRIFEVDPNFEHILTLLRAATNTHEIDRNHYTIGFLASNPDYKQNYQNIIDQMYEVVYHFCCNSFNSNSTTYMAPEELENKFILSYDALFGSLLNRNIMQYPIITTNYDPSIEIWCQMRYLRCIDGTSSTNNNEIRVCSPIANHISRLANINNVDNNSIGLLRMHGSVWRVATVNGKTIKYTQPENLRYYDHRYSRLVHGRPNLLYPGQESSITREPWYDYYRFYRDNLKGKCLFIGYSFSHPEIRNPVVDGLISGKIEKIGILSPNPQKIRDNIDPEGKIPNEKFRLLTGHFGEADGLFAIASWFNNVLKWSTNNNKITQTVKKWKETREAQYF